VQAQAVARVGNWELDVGTSEMWASGEALRIYGLPATSRYIPLSLAQSLVSARDRPRLDDAVTRLFAGHAYDEEFTVLPPNGDSPRVVHSVASLVVNEEGRPTKVVGVVQDITDRRLAEETSRKLLQAVEQSPASIVITDLTGAIEYVNARFTAVTGYSRAEALGQNPRILKSGDKTAADYRELWAKLTSGQEWRGEFRNKRKNGELYWERAVISPVHDATGQVAHFIAVKEDITEQRSLEERLRQAHKMEAVGLLAGGIAHDFNNMLSVVLSYAALAAEDLTHDDPLRADIEEIEKAGRHAADLTRQLLAFSRRQVLEPRVINLNDVLVGIEKMLGRLLGEDIEVVTARGSELRPVHADPGQIEQVVVNLAVNARDAMPDGGRLTLETTNVDLSEVEASALPGARAGRHVRLVVRDTGVGIDDSIQPRIFEPFFTTKEVGKGTGLGLASVLGIVQQSGGTLTVDSAPGAGTTFSIYLPACEPMTAGVETRASAVAPGPGVGKTILVTEDEPQIRKLIGRTLKRAGYAVIEAASPAEALDRSSGHSGTIHVLMTDVVLPGMNGRQLAERLTAARPGLRVLYMSGHAGGVVAGRSVLEKGVAFLPKPFTPSVLLAKLHDVLDVAG